MTTSRTLEAATLKKGTLVIVNYHGVQRRAVVTDTFWLAYAHPSYGHKVEVCLGYVGKDAGANVDVVPGDIVALAVVGEIAYHGTVQYDWLAHCAAALEYLAARDGECPPWAAVLEKPWRYMQEAWLGGHEVPATIESVTIIHTITESEE